MTGPEMLTYVTQVLKRPDKDTEVYEAITDAVVDMRLRLLSDDYSVISSDLASGLVEGDYTLDVPTDFGHLLTEGVLIRDTAADDQYSPLKKISKAYYDELYQDVYHSTVSNRNTGVPCHFAYFGRQIYVGPAVDHGNYEFKINYTTDGVADITSATTTVPFTDKFRKIVRDGTLWLMFQQLENFPESDYWNQEYEKGLLKIKNNDDYNKDNSFCMSYNGC